MYEGNPGEIDFGSSWREVRVIGSQLLELRDLRYSLYHKEKAVRPIFSLILLCYRNALQSLACGDPYKKTKILWAMALLRESNLIPNSRHLSRSLGFY